MSSAKLSNFGAVSSIVASTLGSGITFMPSVYSILGPTTASIIMLFVGLFTFLSIYLLSYASVATRDDSEKKLSYSGIAAKFSQILKNIVAFILLANAILAAYAFIGSFLKIFMHTLSFNDSLKKILEVEGKDTNTSYVIKLVAMACMLLALFFLFQIENLASLSFLSLLSLLIAVMFSLVVSVYGIWDPLPADELKPSEGPSDLFGPLGSIIFALHCQFSYLDIFNSMKDQSLTNVTTVTGLASILATILYSLVGYLGFRAVGHHIGKESLIFAISQKDTKIIDSLTLRYGEYGGKYLSRLIHSLFSIIFFSGALFNLFPVLPILQEWFSMKGKLASRRIIVFGLIVFLFAVSLFDLGSFELLFAISGLFLTTPLSFIFPAIFAIFATPKLTFITVSAGIMLIVSVGMMIFLSLLKFEFISL